MTDSAVPPIALRPRRLQQQQLAERLAASPHHGSSASLL